ncbi:thiosulfate oxidation carrier complex protein SoxZ [Ectothiorhodospiraceae bacterium BW-2]|nr:thiosulfate oxidation carrier complex protein SoxZ [Ectothiorhodospiraceae bacterium BW-2]
MADSIKVRAKVKGDICEVKALIKHPMETGLRKDSKTGKVIPAHFIQEVIVTHKGAEVMRANWGGAISQNPYLSFSFSGAAKGEELTLTWNDNTGESDSSTAKIG